MAFDDDPEHLGYWTPSWLINKTENIVKGTVDPSGSSDDSSATASKLGTMARKKYAPPDDLTGVPLSEIHSDIPTFTRDGVTEWFINGQCTYCDQQTLIFPPSSDSAGLCEDCWLGMK